MRLVKRIKRWFWSLGRLKEIDNTSFTAEKMAGSTAREIILLTAEVWDLKQALKVQEEKLYELYISVCKLKELL